MQEPGPHVVTDPPPSLYLEQRPDRVAVLRVDVPAARLNILKTSFVDEFEAALDTIEAAGDARAVVIASGKPDTCEEFTFGRVRERAADARAIGLIDAVARMRNTLGEVAVVRDD